MFSSSDSPLADGLQHLVTRRQIINKINYLNFRDLPLIVRFRHATLARVLNLPAVPEPCRETFAFYRWQAGHENPKVPPQFQFQDILIDDGDGLIVVHPRNHRCDAVGGVFELPAQTPVVNARRCRRYLCSAIRAEMIQHSARFEGELIDFSASSLLVRLQLVTPQSFSWIQPEAPVHLILSDNRDIAFAAQCRIVRRRWGIETGTCVLEPMETRVQRFKPKRHRSQRLNVTPQPNLIFVHPLTGRRSEMTVVELSGSGFSVEMHRSQDILIPGLVIPAARIVFAGGTTFDCRLQVIHAHLVDTPGKDTIRSGFVILDIPPEQHTRLLTLIYQLKEPNAFINHTQDMDALWRFFFNTGFIYPEKYVHLHPHKAIIQSTFEKIYTHHPSFARSFTYQRMGRVLGHMSMLRFYSRSWMIHHHAAETAESHRAGLIVLDQIGRFINDSHRLYQTRMSYVFCLYRPLNKFPQRVFGGAAKWINDPGGCSQDTFAYLHLPSGHPADLPPAGSRWRLAPADAEDLAELTAFYQQISGGLMVDAFDLMPDGRDIQSLSNEYQAIGFRRQCRLFGLRLSGRPIAVFMANQSDLGLNMADLTSCIQVFVIDSDQLDPVVLRRALARIGAMFPYAPVPVMIFPAPAAAALGFAAEKQYTAWVLNLEHTDRYFDYISRLLRAANRKKPSDSDHQVESGEEMPTDTSETALVENTGGSLPLQPEEDASDGLRPRQRIMGV